MKSSDNILRFPDAEQVEERAAEWAVRIAEGELSDEERTALQSWCSTSARHRDALARLSHLWKHCDALAELADHAAADITVASRGADRANSAVMRRFLPNRRTLLAASIAAVALLIAGKLSQNTTVTPSTASDAVYATTAETGIGERATVALPDGSSMELNTDSAVAVRYAANERIIHLTRGEAHFTVAPNPRRPFSVHAGDRVVTAVGTAFTVQLKPDAIEVTVAEGKISLATAHAYRERVPDVVDSTAPALEAGQSAILQDGREAVATLAPAELERRLAWRQGMLAFAGEPLSHVLQELERYTDVAIEVTDPTLRALPVAGRLRIDDVESMLEALQLMADVRVERLDDRHVRLLPKGRT